MFKDENRHYSLRKLSVGLASVLIGISFASSMNSSSVKADTVESGNNSVQTVVKGSDAAIKTDAKDDANAIESNTKSADEATKEDPNAIAQDIKQKATKGDVNTDKDNSSKLVEKDSITKNDSLIAKNNTAKATSEATEQGLETSVVPHINGNETALNVNGRKVEVKESQAWVDPAKSKLKTATLITTTGKKFNTKMLFASKVMSPANDTNGGFNEATWGTLNVNDWKGSVQGDYYQLTDYTGDVNHIIVPNEADFAKAGISTSGKQVGVTSDFMHTIFRDKTTAQDATVAFSKTDNKMVKAIDNSWYNTWGHDVEYRNDSWILSKGKLTKFDGSNLDVSDVTDMSYMFCNNQISDLSPLANWKVDNVTDMSAMFSNNQISDLSPLANWKVDNVTAMSYMFEDNQISDLSPLVNWKVDNVTDMNYMFEYNQISDLRPLVNWNTGKVTGMQRMFLNNQISDLSPLASWNVDNIRYMSLMFDNNVTTQTKNLQAQRVINFVYPAGYTGKKQDSVTQTVNVPQKVKVELTTKVSKSSNNILDWVTKKETPEAPDPVYFQDYIVPEIKGLLEPDKTVISEQQADITKPINVTVTYRLIDSNTNDAFALDSKNGLHEHANVNDNGGYDEDYWGKLNVNDWNYTVNDNTITITGYKGTNPSSLIIPNGADFDLANGHGTGQSNVEVSSSVMHDLAKNATRIGFSKTANKKVIASNAIWSDAFGGMTNEPGTDSNADGGIKYGSPNLTQMDLHNLDTAAITDVSALFNGGSNLTTVGDLSEWNTSNVTRMCNMFQNASSLINIGNLSEWQTGNVTDMHNMFYNATNLTNIGDLSKWQTGNVTNMSIMFYNVTNLTNIGNLNDWDTSKVTDMSWMFGVEYGKQSHLTNIGDLSKWQTGNVTNMSYMFYNATNLTNIGDLSKWNTSKVTNMLVMFGATNALRHLNISNWNLTKLVNKDSMQYMFADDTDLVVIANNLTLPTWYQNEINDADYFWNNHMVVITNVPELIKSTGDINNLKIDDQDASRSIFYDSKGSNDAIKVLTDANDQYIADYNKANPSKLLKLSNIVDQSAPISLANASFVTVPKEFNLTVHFEDIDPNADKDSDTVKQELAKTVELSGNKGDTADLSQVQLPTNFELSDDLPSATFGNTDSVTIQLKHKTETSVESLPATRTINVHLPNGTTKVYQQIIGYQRDVITDLVTKMVTRGTWTVNDVTSSFTIDDVKQLEHSYVLRNGNYNFAGIKLPKVPGYKAKVSKNNGLLLVSYLALIPEKSEINTNLNDQFSNNLLVNSTVKSDLIVKSDMYQVVNDNHNWQLPVIKNYELKFATNKNQIIFAYTKDKQNNYRFILTVKDGQYRLATFDKENKLLKTYSIKSYDELAKIINSLVLMNIA